MAQDLEVKGRISIDTGDSDKKMVLLKDEIKKLNKEVKEGVVGSDEQVSAHRRLRQAQSELKKEIAESSTTFGKLKTSIAAVGPASTVAKFGLEAVGLSLKALGIGLITAAIAILVEKFDAIKDAIFKLIPGMQIAAKWLGKLVDFFTDLIGVTSDATRALANYEKQTKRNNETIENEIKLLEARGGKEAEVFEKRKQLVENELNVYRQRLKVKGSLDEEEQKRFRELKTEKEVLDIKENNRLKKLSEDQQKDINDANKKKADASKKASDEERKREQELEDFRKRLQKLKDENELSQIKDKNERLNQQAINRTLEEKQQIEAQIKANKLTREQGNLLIIEVEKKLQNDLKAIKDKELLEELKRQEDIAKFRADLADKFKPLNLDPQEQERQKLARELLMTEQEQELFALEEQYKKKYELAKGNKILLDALDEEFALKKKQLLFVQAEQELQVISSSAAQISQVVGQQTAVGKGLAAASAVINTYSAANKVLASDSPSFIVNPFARFVAAATTIAAGIANVKRILSTQVPGAGGSGGGASISAPPPVSPSIGGTQLNAASIQGIGNAAQGGVNRAFVLDSDIRNNSERNARLNRAARLN